MDISHREAKACEKLLAFKKRKPPQVRQTLTSKFRMLKANPVLMYELGKKVTSNSDNKEESIFTPLTTLVSVLDASVDVQSKAVKSKTVETKTQRHVNTNVAKPKTASKPEWKKPLPRDKPTLESRKKLLNKYTIVRKNQQKDTLQTQKLVTKNSNKTSLSTIKATSSLTTKQDNENVVPLDVSSHNVPSTSNRRSTIIVQTPSFSRKLVVEPNRCVEKSKIASHNDNIQECSISTTHKTQNPEIVVNCGNNAPASICVRTPATKLPVPTPKKNENVQDLNIQKKSALTPMQGTASTKMAARTLTPSNSTRRISLFATPMRVKSVPISNSCSKDMTRRLSVWLQNKGKNARDYHHLKCFGVQAENVAKIEAAPEQEKENIEVINGHHYNTALINDHHYNTGLSKDVKLVCEGFDLETVSQEALMDLHKLILDGYPPEQCETWLKLIKQRHRLVEEKPQYWECRAALEQTKGNINLAVECYKTAIIQGAEVENVDKSLDQLLRKFGLLDINGDTDAYSNNNERSKIVKDMRNVFKSSVIQFAVQERTFKKKGIEGTTIEKKMFATPVRRSTRLSRSAFTSTPGVHIFSSLQEIDSSVRDTLNFQCNNALKD